LLLDLLSTVSRGSVPVRALVRSGELFGIEPNAIRVALARLRAAGLVHSDKRGRYRLGERARAVHGQVASWRATERRIRPWTGGWLAVHTGPLGRSDRRALRRRLRALAFLGFRALEPGLELRPDNLAEPAKRTRERLEALGLDARALVCRLDGLDAARDARARTLWDMDALCRAYRERRSELRQSAERLAEQPRERAMVESFTLGGATLRQLAYDPLLPEELAANRERDRLVEVMRDYDRLGRAAWAGMLEVDGEHTPADLRAFEAVGALAHAPGV
jgi:phenylacetic acid degradation operon negative regulatory protein